MLSEIDSFYEHFDRMGDAWLGMTSDFTNWYTKENKFVKKPWPAIVRLLESVGNGQANLF